ncbi:hypothetical protein [Caenimonas koreensis]|uniref:hypothetical protein n=1 Tax=Caenimonas koreensis TaxID=367474 RepID=UPI00378302B8
MNERQLQFWCQHPPSWLSDSVKGKCESLREQVARIAGASALSLDERCEKYVQVLGRTTPRRSSIVDLALNTQHGEIAGAVLLGLLGSGAQPDEIQAMLLRAGIDVARVSAAVRALPDDGSGWADELADEIDALGQRQRQPSADHACAAEQAPVRIVLPRAEAVEPQPRRTDPA